MILELLQQTVNVVPNQDFGTSITALIIAVATAVGTVASLVLGILSRVGVFKNKEAITEAAKTTLTFAQKTVEQEDKIKTMAEVTYSLAPEEAKKILDEQSNSLEKLRADVKAAELQLARLKPILIDKAGAAADPDADATLPR